MAESKRSSRLKDTGLQFESTSFESRTYGFMKATRSEIPIPKPHDPLDKRSIIERLRTVQSQQLDLDDDENVSFSKPSPILSVCSEKTPFELKRKLFDEAEFTITRGIKLSGFPHPTEDHGSASSCDELESHSRKRNSKMCK